MTTSRTAIGYCRVSTSGQATKGASLELQETKIRAWAALHDFENVVIYHDDGISGKEIGNRQQLLAALEHADDVVNEGDAALVVYSLSRLTRSVRDAITIADDLRLSEIQFVSLHEQIDTTNAMGRAFFKIIATLGELERELIVERTVDALAHKRSKGEALGNTPYGFRNDNLGRRIDADRPGMLVVEPAEIDGLRRMLVLAVNPNTTFAGIGRVLDDEGHAPRRGTNWDRGSVRKIVKYYRSPDGQYLMSIVERAE